MRRRRRPEPRPWDENWRNPDMKVMRTWQEPMFFGGYRRVSKLVSAGESSELSEEALDNPDFPTWDRDKTYF